MTMTQKTKILLVDDHPLVREWLANLINEETDLEVCGQAGTSQEALAVATSLTPDCAVVDLSLESGSGLELVKYIKAQLPSVKTLVLSMHDEMLYAERAMRAGAAGYIMKREATGKILDAIRAVMAGGLFYSAAVNEQLAQKVVQGGTANPMPLEELSDRELEVFNLLGQGLSARQISEKMNLSFKTVHAYCSRICEKLNFAGINELTFHAIRWHKDQQPQ
jgi:DNA-binding NarL/FixJ family response regulator